MSAPQGKVTKPKAPKVEMVPVVRWIGQKIADVTALIDELGLEK